MVFCGNEGIVCIEDKASLWDSGIKAPKTSSKMIQIFLKGKEGGVFVKAEGPDGLYKHTDLCGVSVGLYVQVPLFATSPRKM